MSAANAKPGTVVWESGGYRVEREHGYYRPYGPGGGRLRTARRIDHAIRIVAETKDFDEVFSELEVAS